MSWTIEVEDTVAIVTMNSNKANVQNDDFFVDLHEAFDRLDEDHGDKSVVLTGRDHIFSAGIDFKYTFPIFARSDPDEITDWFERYRATNLRLFTFSRPLIAAINGHAIAGGLITALAADYRLCVTEDVKLGLNEVPVGITMPSIYVELIRYACGNHVTALSTLFGELYAPTRALRFGFVHELIEAADLRDAAIRRASMIPQSAFDAYAGSKRSLLAPVLKRIEDISTGHDRKTNMSAVSERTKKTNAAALKKLSP